ncbi:MAG: CBS domain-containing protein [Deltaproteobacteria bacterium]|nr:CBS domain-containing protein [Deltaproteobacteria bacterium]
MEQLQVKDLTVPLDEYATVSIEATLYEAVLALEKAQEELDRKRYLYLHRAVLVLGDGGKVVGKVSQLDVLTALEPKYRQMGQASSISRAGFSPQFLREMLEKFSLYTEPLVDICRKASELKVKDFMYTPGEGEYVDEQASLPEAIHQLVMGHHQSLLVTRGEKIVGVLRLTDVFKEIFRIMKSCEI